ncbi:MAG: DUF4252 domain-containing protein [Holophagales bacterium]|jgi:hypothetical protein|nr:DUF4252 domain-containing protein [Holophagales bacterium]
MRHTSFFLSLLLCLPICAQSPRINIGHIEKLTARATECVEVTLDGLALKLALKVLKKDPIAYNVAKGIKGIYVNAFEFDANVRISSDDIEMIRQQIKTPPWEQIVSVKSKKDGEDASVYILADPKTEEIKGLAVIAVEKHSLALVNIVGSIKLEELSMLEGNFGLPKMDLTKVEK